MSKTPNDTMFMSVVTLKGIRSSININLNQTTRLWKPLSFYRIFVLPFKNMFVLLPFWKKIKTMIHEH